MLLFLFFCHILLTPFAFGNNTSTTVGANSTAITSNESPKVKFETPKVNKTKEIVVSEGGAIIENTPSLTLGKENNTIFSYKELGKDTSAVGPSRVVPRKGVVYKENANDTDIQVKLDKSHEENKDHSSQLNQHKTTIPPVVTKSDYKNNNKTNVIISTAPNTKINKTVVHKKPMILSYDTLAHSDVNTQSNLQIPAIKSSSKSLVVDQVPSPKESGPTTRVQPMSASRHPGMIMPVVITILVVPMFAVLGYMALRRGQDAWKNRHYKRMDFLLDGMYND